jgi:dCTP diphosphatase
MPSDNPLMSCGNGPASLDNLLAQIREFVRERDWSQYHSPKNLSAALSVEAAELVEIFQWLTEDESRNLSPEQKAHAAEEIGDVLIYLVNLADKLGIEPLEAAFAKLEKNRKKYPVEKAKGRAAKYHEF